MSTPPANIPPTPLPPVGPGPAPAAPDSPALSVAGPLVWFLPGLVFTLLVSIFSLVGFAIIEALENDAPDAALLPYFVATLIAFAVARAINLVLDNARRQRGRILLGYLEDAVRLNLPLDPFLAAAQAGERGPARWQLQQLRDGLAGGLLVGAALRRAIPGLPEGLAEELSAAERLGRLQPTLTRIVEESLRPSPAEQDDLDPFYRLYPFGLLALIMFVVLFYGIFILPKFQEIFRDFRTTLPWATVRLMEAMHLFFDDPLAGVLMILLSLIMTTLVGLQLRRIFTPWWPRLRSTALRDALVWWLPGCRQLARTRAMASLCRTLADGTQTGQPFPRCLEAALTLRLNRHFRRAVENWHGAVAAGQPAAQAAAQAGLPAILVGFLAASASPRAAGPAATPALAHIFEFLARYYRDRFSRALIALRAALVPVVVLVCGLIVGFILYALFSPLVTLINSVMGSAPKGYWL